LHSEKDRLHQAIFVAKRDGTPSPTEWRDDLQRRIDSVVRNDKVFNTAPDSHGTEIMSFGLTAPLLTKSDGSKFGKTESGAVWLSHKRPISNEPGTSPYGYYQFWLNTADEDVSKYLRIFTDRPLDEISDIEQRHAGEPHKREAQRTLARDATTLLHGQAATANAEHAAKALFSGDVKSLPADMIEEVFVGVPTTDHDRSLLDDGDAVELLTQTSLASSKGEARKHLKANAIAVNGEKIAGGVAITRDHLLHDRYLLLRRGKKNWHVCRFSG
jgi:tyrosyl-tRNA synthetase